MNGHSPITFDGPATFEGKLKTLLVLTATLAVALSLVGVVGYDIIATRKALVYELETLADVVGANGVAALSFSQPEDGSLILESLSAKSHIIAASFRNGQGEPFASYRRQGIPDSEIEAAERSLDLFLEGEGRQATPFNMVLQRPLVIDGEFIGSILLVSNLAPLRQHLRSSLTTAAFVFLVCTSLAWWIGSRWLGRVLRPIHGLTSTAEHIAQTHDYGSRAPKHGDDELGRLTDRFNGMLEQIEAVNQDLARSNADLERFAYVASHDLQEPLRVITSYSQLLSESLGPGQRDDITKYLHYMVSAADRMRAMIKALLDYSRVGSQAQALDTVDTQHALGLALQNLSMALRESGGEVTHDPLPPIRADALLMVQLFQNLVGNALKFQRPDEPPRIHVSALCDTDGICRFAVRDNGIGMDPGATSSIFEVFQRLHSRSEYPGTGIGLAVCRRIVEHHGGKIWVESSLGEGSTFFFTGVCADTHWRPHE